MLLEIALMAATLPDAPSASKHVFWGKSETSLTLVHAGTRTVDAVQTCHHMKTVPGWHEELGLPNSCGAVAGFSAAFVGGEILTRYFAHKRGWHRFEKWNSILWTASAAFGIAYSYRGR